jgi:glycosyltransferase involved in cell wall biosynthesis
VGSSGFSAADPLTPYELELRRLAGPLGAAVQFVPFVDRKGVLEEYQRATLFCAPSNWDDPCPLIVPEAMACGLATVASRRGGIPELGAEAVLYFDPPDVQGLAQQLGRLLDDQEYRDRLAGRARRRAAELSWQTQYRVLQEAISGARQPASAP